MSMAANGHNVQIAKIFVVCNQPDTAPVWGFILRQQGLVVTLEHSLKKALMDWSDEKADLVVLDLEAEHNERMDAYRKFRAGTLSPILLFLPSHNETHVLDAYNAGVDEVVVKPISPPIFLAKILAWVRRGWAVPANGYSDGRSGRVRLAPAHRGVILNDGQEIRLTNLEYHLLQVLMSRPGSIFQSDDLIQTVWGDLGGDHVLLKNVVYRLRKKMDVDPSQPSLIHTHDGGYSFEG
jgi:DNA-binding response OmpR family regulator